MTINRLKTVFGLTALVSALLVLGACAPATSTNANSGEKIDTSGAVSGSAVDASEPEEYTATVAVSVGTTGSIDAKAKALQAKVARLGDRRRLEMLLPNGSDLVYLTIGDRQMVILPDRAEYAEIDKQTFGLELRKLVAPDQIINKIKSYDEVKREGEQQWYGRDVIKYSLLKKDKEKTAAGEVEANSYTLIDKATHLPLKTVLAVRSESGSIAGVNGLKVVTEITNLETTANKSLLEEPKKFDKVSSKDVRNQIEKFYDSAKGLVAQLYDSADQAVN